MSLYFLHRFQWFRRFLGGRWEYWYIDICLAKLWLRIAADEPDDRYQACSVGPRIAREDYPRTRFTR